MDIRNRVTEMRIMRAEEIQDHDGNWRTHPRFQRDGLRGVLEAIGIADGLKAYYSERQGGLTLIDGHLRKEDYPDTGWPVLVLDVNDAEADVLLATLDPIAALAEAESTALDALLRTVETESEAVKALLEKLAFDTGAFVPDFLPVGIDEQPRLDQKSPVTCPECGCEFVPKS